MDPRVSIKDFYNQLTKLNINACINTSSLWEEFFSIVSKEIKKGKNFDNVFDEAKAWMVGGEGPSVKNIKKWDEIMQTIQKPSNDDDKRDRRIYGGYGLSELFSGLCIDRVDSKPNYDIQVPRVGAIQAGMVAGVFDENGKELSYNQRGELWVKSKALMKGYYGKTELTNETIVDGWLKTGDIAEIDKDGFVYIWGRKKSVIKTNDGTNVYLFDIENMIRENSFIQDAVVLNMPTVDNGNNLVAHIVWSNNYSYEQKKEFIIQMNNKFNSVLPNGIVISAYSEHDNMLPYSPTTLKRDKNGMSQQTLGYIQVVDNELVNTYFIIDSYGKYSQEFEPYKARNKNSRK